MSGEDGRGTVDQHRLADEQRIAHEGALARWAGRCARHPWRVVSTWVGIFVVLIALNAAFHGKLINDFKIPGSDTQKATDLITAKFGGEKGAALRASSLSSNNRLDSPAGRPSSAGCSPPARRRSRTWPRTPKDVAGDHEPAVGHEPTVRRRPGRVLRHPVRPHRLRAAAIGDRGGRGSATRDRRSGRHAGRVHRGGRERAADAGHQRPDRPVRGLRHPARPVPRARADGDPTALRDRRRARGVPDPVPRRAPDPLQHDHRDPRADDRPRRGHRLHAPDRHPVPAVPARRPDASGSGSSRGRDRRTRGDLRGRDGCDLDHRAGVDRPRLHHEARNRQRPRRPDGGAARELPSARSAVAARTEDRPRPVRPAARRRVPRGAATNTHCRLGAVRLEPCEGRAAGRHRRPAAARLAGARRAPRSGRCGNRAEGPDDPQGVRPADEGLRARASPSRSRSW